MKICPSPLLDISIGYASAENAALFVNPSPAASLFSVQFGHTNYWNEEHYVALAVGLGMLNQTGPGTLINDCSLICLGTEYTTVQDQSAGAVLSIDVGQWGSRFDFGVRSDFFISNNASAIFLSVHGNLNL